MMRKRRRTAALASGVALAAALGVALLTACGNGDTRDETGMRLSLSGTLAGADTAGYERALSIREFTFPADHGPHPGFRTEWWYVTGNVSDAQDRAFGFQFTLFRSALSPQPPDVASDWATNQAFMGHFTLTDVRAGAFHAFERFTRGAGGLAGATAGSTAGEGATRTAPGGDADFHVWVDDWSLSGSVEADGFPMRMRAAEDGIEIDLRLDEGKPVVLQGQQGLSQKGPELGNASYYYAHTRLPATGTIVVRGDTLDVGGLAWMDREWSTSALSGDQVGWDWFSLQLEDGWDVMVYQLRLADGAADPLSDGALIAPDGSKTRLEWGGEVRLETTAVWASPIDGVLYPSGWRLAVPSRGLELLIEPVLENQELDLAFRYWEGAVRVRGTGVGGGPVEGSGYVELTGYADAP